MDYIFTSVLGHHDPSLHKVVSYDITCQWIKHLLERLSKLPSAIRPTVGSFEVVIPKLHVHSHNPPCPTDYSFNYLQGAGRTDGEGIEQVHSMSGPMSASTKQMGPGYRHDYMDAHWLFWNWQKIIGMGKSQFNILELFTH
jgi:hypothetical protein